MTQAVQSITIGITVKDVNEASKWYKTLLGDVATIEPAPGILELQLSENAWLQLDDTRDLKIGGAIIRLETCDIDAIHTKVKALNPDVGDIELVEGVVRYFDFEDLAGNGLSYYQVFQETIK